MVVDEDVSTLRTLTDALETRGYQVVESKGADLVSRAVDSKPDIIILNSVLSSEEAVRSLRFEKGMENVLFLIYP
jgi:DNA-binding response OmpR family regulator